MTKREKRLLWVVVGGVSVFAFIGGGNRWFIEPFRDADERTHSLQETLLAHENEFIEAKRAQNSLRGLAQRTFGVDPEETSARIGEYLTDAITAVGLDDRKFSRVPVGQRVLGRSRVRDRLECSRRRSAREDHRSHREARVGRAAPPYRESLRATRG